MIAAILLALFWFGLGFVVARTIFHESDWFSLLTVSLGTGLVLHIALVNGLFYLLDPLAATWLSFLIAVIAAALLLAWQWQKLSTLQLGLSRRSLVGILIFIFFLWLGTLPALIEKEYYDREWHLATTGVIANVGLPISNPVNPDSCLYYHYGGSLPTSVLYHVAPSLSLSQSVDWGVGVSVLAVLGLAANVAWKINGRKSIVPAILGVALLLFAASANWISYIVTRIDATEEEALFAYFYKATQPILRDSIYSMEQPYAIGYFFNPYSLALHTVSINFALVCVLLALNALLLNNLTVVRAAITGVVIGTLGLFYETLWPIAAGMVGLYGVYTLYQNRPPLKNWLLIFGTMGIVASGLVIFQGGVLTDTLFCQNYGENQASGESVQTVQFPDGPGYYSWLTGYVSLKETHNWSQGLAEWGFVPLLYPFLVWHTYRRKQTAVLSMLLLCGVVILGFLFANFSSIGQDAGRIAVYPLVFIAFLGADWFYTRFTSAYWQRGLALLLFLSIIYGGVALYYGQLTQPSNDENDRYFRRAFLDTIDSDIAETWFGQLGDTIVFDTSSDYRTRFGRTTATFGTYNLAVRNRSDFSDIHYRDYILTNPDPLFLDWRGIEYLYFDERTLGQTPLYARQNLNNDFELIFLRETTNQVRVLFRVIPPESREIPDYYERIINGTIVLEELVGLEIGQYVEAEDSIFMPRDNHGLLADFDFANVQVIDDTNRPQFESWIASRLPQDLAGFDYLLIDDVWFTVLTDPEKIIIQDQYTMVREWRDGSGKRFWLYAIP